MFWQQVSYLLENFGNDFLRGIMGTLVLAIVGTMGGLLIGLGLALLRNLKVDAKDARLMRVFKIFLSKIAMCYIQLFRGTPMMVQAIIIYYGSKQVFNLGWSYFVCGLFVITINTAAYMAEIIRSGINGIDKGQIEAARSQGMSHFQTMFHIVFPQVIRNSIPSIGNEFIVNIKDSSVLNVITVTELFFAAKMAAADTYMYLPTYIIICVIYLLLTIIFTQLLRLVEHLMDKPQKIRIGKHGVAYE